MESKMKVMEDQLISFETAMLAKEKGFNHGGEVVVLNCYRNNGVMNDTDYSGYFPAPTQSLLQKWLRKNKILVEVNAVDHWNSFISRVFAEDFMSPFFEAYTSNEYKTYEEALEKGLFEALKLIHDIRN